jgi:hypothetical protein
MYHASVREPIFIGDIIIMVAKVHTCMEGLIWTRIYLGPDVICATKSIILRHVYVHICMGGLLTTRILARLRGSLLTL